MTHLRLVSTTFVFALVALPACGGGDPSPLAPDAGGASTDAGGGAATGGAFGSRCTKDDQCTTGADTCVFSTKRGGIGFCSKPCDAVSDCPSQYDCQFIGGAARKYCVPEDQLVGCKNTCEDFGASGCFSPTGLAQCNAACDAASVTKRKDFAACVGEVACSSTCLEALATGAAAWLADKPAKPACARQTTLDPTCNAMGKGKAGYACDEGKTPSDPSCDSGPAPDTWCCAK